MKIFNKLLIGSLIVFMVQACEDGIDPISKVDPGPDQSAPSITINYPFEGALIRVREDVTPINIDFVATDDIEIESVVLSLNGTKIGEYTDFKDYRRAIQVFRFENLTNGTHTLTVAATDKSGKVGTASVNFEKVTPYEPKYEGEIIYLPFDGDYLELLSISEATPAGSPTFVDGIQGKAVSLNGDNKAYITFPGDVLASAESFSLSFWVKPQFVDKDGNGEIDGILGLVNLSNATRFWGNIDFFVENGSKPAASKMVVHVTNDDSETWFTEVNNVANFFGAWSHHVVTYDGEALQFKYYIDGVLKFTKAAGWTDALTFKDSGPMVFGTVHFQTTPSLTTGSENQPWASYLTGLLDEIRIFNRALTAEDVQQIYNDVQ